jgi:hypothetical protein
MAESNYTLPIGPLSFVIAIDNQLPASLGLLEVAQGDSDAAVFTFTPAGESTPLTGVPAPIDPDTGSFNARFSDWNNQVLSLEGQVCSNFLINGKALTGPPDSPNATLLGLFQAILLPIQVSIKTGDNTTGIPDGVLAISLHGDLSFTPTGGSPIALGSVDSAWNPNTGALSRVTFPAGVTINLYGNQYQYISGSFTSSNGGTGSIGPSGPGRQSGDDIWMPAGQNK